MAYPLLKELRAKRRGDIIDIHLEKILKDSKRFFKVLEDF